MTFSAHRKWNMAMFMHLYSVYSCLHTAIPELNSYNRDHMSQLFTVWTFMERDFQFLLQMIDYLNGCSKLTEE